MYIKGAALSNTGKVRDSNEDAFVVNSKSTLFLVADGMGGHAAGEIASRITAKTVAETLTGYDPTQDPGQRLLTAVYRANTCVYEAQRQKPAYHGMGSTLTALLFRGDNYYLAQVGDSRAYLLRDGELRQLSRDHSVVWPLFECGELTKNEIAHHPRKHLITRCIGPNPEVETDLLCGQVRENDVYLLCSDGLTDVLADNEIQCVLTGCGRQPKKACKMLIQAANAGGGPDNITAVVVSVREKKPPLHYSLPLKLSSFPLLR